MYALPFASRLMGRYVSKTVLKRVWSKGIDTETAQFHFDGLRPEDWYPSDPSPQALHRSTSLAHSVVTLAASRKIYHHQPHKLLSTAIK